MSRVVITIETDNDAFWDEDGNLIPGQVFFCLDQVKDRWDVAKDLGFCNVKDINGNTVGQAVIMGEGY